MSTTDGGMHWKKLSPDLGVSERRDAAAAAAAAPARRTRRWRRRRAQPAARSNRSRRRALSPGIIWVGTNNGLIKLTRNHGTTWDDVTIPDLPNPDARRHLGDRRVAHRFGRRRTSRSTITRRGDYTPYFYRTHDFGKTWTKIVNGMRDRSAERKLCARDSRRHEEAGVALRRHRELDVRLVRRRRRLAIAHAQSAEHVVSRHRDQGQRSRVGTYGRSFWILDDYLAAAADHAGDRVGAGASVQAGRRDPRAPQRERRHAVPAGGAARAQSAARRARLLLLEREAVERHHARRARRGGQRRASLSRARRFRR